MLEAPRRLGDTKPAGERKGDIPHEDHDVVHQDGRYRAEEAATTNMDTVTWLETVNQEQHNLPGEPAGQCGVTLSNHLGVPSLPLGFPFKPKYCPGPLVLRPSKCHSHCPRSCSLFSEAIAYLNARVANVSL